MREGTCFERRSSSIVAAELGQVSRQKRGKKVALGSRGWPSSASIEKKSRYCLDRGDVTFFCSFVSSQLALSILSGGKVDSP